MLIGQEWQSDIKPPFYKAIKLGDNKYRVVEIKSSYSEEKRIPSERGNFNWLTDEVVDFMNQRDED
jgi:hypothetical protein